MEFSCCVCLLERPALLEQLRAWWLRVLRIHRKYILCGERPARPSRRAIAFRKTRHPGFPRMRQGAHAASSWRIWRQQIFRCKNAEERLLPVRSINFFPKLADIRFASGPRALTSPKPNRKHVWSFLNYTYASFFRSWSRHPASFDFYVRHKAIVSGQVQSYTHDFPFAKGTCIILSNLFPWSLADSEVSRRRVQSGSKSSVYDFVQLIMLRSSSSTFLTTNPDWVIAQNFKKYCYKTGFESCQCRTVP